MIHTDACVLACALLLASAIQIPAQSPRYRDPGRGYLPDLEGRLIESLVGGDFDGDGDLDVFAGGWSGSPHRMLVNDGDGVFRDEGTTRLPAATPNNLDAIAFDFDGDGDQDLFLANFDADRLYRNDGSGQFVDVSATLLPQPSLQDGFTEGVFAADLDGDGDLDLACASATNRRASFLLINEVAGSGAFRAVFLSGIRGPLIERGAVCGGDLDGDGDVDLLFTPQRVIGGLSDYNTLLLNDGVAGFTEPRRGSGDPFPSPGLAFDRVERPWDAVATDLTGDGLPEVVIVGRSGSVILRNFGNAALLGGTFGVEPPASTVVRSGDFNADGQADLLFSTEVWLSGRLGLAPSPHAHAMRMTTAVVGDFDGDGAVDLLHGDRTGVSFGQPAFRGVDSWATTVHRAGVRMLHWSDLLVDLDADGDLDEVRQTVLLPTFETALEFVANDGAGFAADAPASTWVLQPTPGGSVGGFAGLHVRRTASPRPEILISVGAAVARVTMDAQGRLIPGGPRLELASDAEIWGMAVFDLEGDGDEDVLVIAHEDNALANRSRMFLDEGAHGMVDRTQAVLGTPPLLLPSDVWSADLDADGDPDVVLSTRTASGSTRPLILENIGGRTLSESTTMSLPDDPTLRGIQRAPVDLDGDGAVELLPFDQILWNDGRGVFAEDPARALPADFHPGLIVDADQDGDPDMLSRDGAQQVTRLLVNDGSGRFTVDDTAVPETDRDGWPVIVQGVADVDGDLDSDIVTRDQPLFNQLRQAEAPHLARLGRDWVVRASWGSERGRGPGAMVDMVWSLAGGQVRVPGLGLVRIDPASSRSLGAAALPLPDSVAEFVQPVPNLRNLVGIEFVAQGLLMDPSGTLRITNPIRETVYR